MIKDLLAIYTTVSIVFVAIAGGMSLWAHDWSPLIGFGLILLVLPVASAALFGVFAIVCKLFGVDC